MKEMWKTGATWNFTYDANGMRTQRTNGSVTYTYLYNGSQLTQMTRNNVVMRFSYGTDGRPLVISYNDTPYYYITNLQGDVVAIVNSSGTTVVKYVYDAWGRLLSTTGSMANTLGQYNPLRYRGYIYDQETRLYYLQSRYYSPTWGRFLNADDIDYLGAGSNLNSYNLYAYCGNNPVMGYDPTGLWDWGGVIAGVGIIAVTIIAVMNLGISSPTGAIIAGAAIITGAVTTYAAATDSVMVVDLSYSKQALPNYYGKGGGSVVIDFENDNANFYPHLGGGKGYSDGLSYSVGMVGNYEQPNDYAKHFLDINAGYYAGLDHCWNPLEKHDSATQATAVTFSSGGSYGFGYDYYFAPIQIFAW